jgi:hypothetical protein
MAGYDGLALSLYDRNAQSFEDLGAVNMFSITVSDATTITSGYIQSFYTSITQTGSVTAPAQINAFAADIFLGGAQANEISGAYIYFGESGTATFGNQLSGYTVYFGSFASATVPAQRAGFHCYSEEATATNATFDAGLNVECAGAAGTWGSVLGTMGVTLPNYFLHIPTAPGEERMFSTGAMGNPSAAAGWLKVRVQTTNYWIALHATCTS